MTKTYIILLFYSFIFYWSCTIVCAERKIKESIELTAFPPLKPAKAGERIFIYVQIINKGISTVEITGGKKDPGGIIIPDKYVIESRSYKGADGHYTPMNGGFNAKSKGDGNRRLKLEPKDTVMFKIECVPFLKDTDAKFCHLTITLSVHNVETKEIDHLMPSLVILRD